MLTDPAEEVQAEMFPEDRRRMEEYLDWRNRLSAFDRRIVEAIDGEPSSVADGVRNAIDLLSVYAEEYDFPEDSVRHLRQRLEHIAEDAASLEG